MCGVAGICRLTRPGAIPIERIARMIGAQQHRGPDESGLYRDHRAALGHSRLSIVDLAGGLQPIHNEDESLWITYNGEVYNHPELRKELEAKGHRFYTHCDTEVILHLYEEKGASCVHDLNGQFAFAIWDARKHELFMARDRLGVQPLHYAIHDGELVFASEIKAIFAGCDIPRRLDPVALDQVFTVWTTLPGRTAFEAISELPPGHHATLSAGGLTVERYWSPPFYPPDQLVDLPFDELQSEAYRLLHDAVRVRLRADVPVGSYLSGGLDSSAVTALIARDFDSQLQTFGIRFEDEVFDEGPFQQLMVGALQLDHRELLVTSGDIAGAFPDVVWHSEKPLLRTAPVPLFLLSRLVRDNGIKVVLTGEGSDEFFGGYNIFREAMIRRFMARQPDSKWRPILLQQLYPEIFRNSAVRTTHAAFFGRDLDRTDDPLFSHRIRWAGTERNKVFFTDELRSRIGVSAVYDEIEQTLPADFARWPALSQAQYLEISIFMSNYLLSSQGDRVAMAHSVEVRPPFLDHRLIEFLGRVRPTWKLLGMKEKHLLKRTLQKLLPDSIVNRSKHPYRAPVSQALLHKAAQPYVRELLSEPALRESGFFDPNRVRLLLNKAEKNGNLGEFDSMALAGVVSTQLLHLQYVKHFPRQEIRPAAVQLRVDRLESRTLEGAS
jgi:asparagine synthase (glutamine-hydrolysing)